MWIKFTHDFRGKATGELFYRAGEIISIDTDAGRELVRLEHAVEADLPLEEAIGVEPLDVVETVAETITPFDDSEEEADEDDSEEEAPKRGRRGKRNVESTEVD